MQINRLLPRRTSAFGGKADLEEFISRRHAVAMDSQFAQAKLWVDFRDILICRNACRCD
jgi:hypothetical protein